MIKDLCISSCQQAQSGSKQAADEVDDRWDSASTFNDYMIRVLKVIMGAEVWMMNPKILLTTPNKNQAKTSLNSSQDPHFNESTKIFLS